MGQFLRGIRRTFTGGVLIALVMVITVTPAVNAATPPDIPEVATSVLLDRDANPPVVPTRASQAGFQGIEIAADHALVKETYPLRQMDAARIINIDVAGLRADIDVAINSHNDGGVSQISLAVHGEPIEYSTVSTFGDPRGEYVAWSGTTKIGGTIHIAGVAIYAGTIVMELEHTPINSSPSNPVTVEMVQPVRDQRSDARAAGVQASLAVRSTDFSNQIPHAEPISSSGAGVAALQEKISNFSGSGNEDVIDVMIAYSTDARNSIDPGYQGDITLVTNVIHDFNEVNAALINSELDNNVRVRLVQLARYDFASSEDDGDEILRMLTGTVYNEDLAEIRPERDRTGADIVIFIHDDLDVCGQAHVRDSGSIDYKDQKSYIVIRYDALVQAYPCSQNYTMAHEFGHSFGIAHENEAFGYWATWARAIEVNTSSAQFTTVTARYDACCGRLLQYSNPAILVDGEWAGATYNNGARAIGGSLADRTAWRMEALWPTTNNWIDVESKYNKTYQFYSVASDGRTRPHNPFSGGIPKYYGDPGFYGSGTVSDIVGMASDPDGAGYWFADSAGCMWYYYTASYGSMCNLPLNEPIVGIEEYKSPTGGTKGYWMVASDGGIFAFNAPFHGSMGGVTLNSPMVGMARVPGGTGYWTVASDGGIFAFNAPFHGSLGGQTLNSPIIGMASTTSAGYWLFAADGTVYGFGTLSSYEPASTGEAKTAGSGRYETGYWQLEADGDLNVCTQYGTTKCYDVNP